LCDHEWVLDEGTGHWHLRVEEAMGWEIGEMGGEM